MKVQKSSAYGFNLLDATSMGINSEGKILKVIWPEASEPNEFKDSGWITVGLPALTDRIIAMRSNRVFEGREI